MTIQEEAFRLAEIVPREPGTSLPPGATDGQIEGFRVREQVAIPPEVREWLEFSDGPVIGPGGIFGLDDYRKTYRSVPEFRERQWLPLGTDGCGDYYVLALNSEDLPLRPVYFIDAYDTNYPTPTYAVASGFWQFLRFLLRKEMGERGWPFQPEFVLAADPDLARVRSARLPWVADDPS